MRGEDRSQGLWPTVFLFPLIGLPIGFVLIIVLLFMNLARAAPRRAHRKPSMTTLSLSQGGSQLLDDDRPASRSPR